MPWKGRTEDLLESTGTNLRIRGHAGSGNIILVEAIVPTGTSDVWIELPSSRGHIFRHRCRRPHSRYQRPSFRTRAEAIVYVDEVRTMHYLGKSTTISSGL